MSMFALTSGMIHLVDEGDHAVDAIEQRQWNGSNSRAICDVPGLPAWSASRRQLSTAVRHCSFGGITSRFQMYSPKHEQEVLRLQFIDQIEIGVRAFDVKPLHARVEIDQADGDAGRR